MSTGKPRLADKEFASENGSEPAAESGFKISFSYFSENIQITHVGFTSAYAGLSG